MLGMMFGLGLLGLYSFYLKITFNSKYEERKFDFLKKYLKQNGTHYYFSLV